MYDNYVIDYNALAAWGTVASAVATFWAVVVALRQSSSAGRDLQRQLRHQHALDQRNSEQQLLTGMLGAVRLRYETIRDYGAALEGEMETADVVTQGVRSAVDALLRATSKSTAEFAAQIHVMSALRDHHAAEGRSVASAEYEEIVRRAIYAHQATKNFEQWSMRQLQVRDWKPRDLEGSPFEEVEKTHNEAMIAVANRIAALLAPPE